MQSKIKLINSSEAQVLEKEGLEVFLRDVPTKLNLGDLSIDDLRILIYYISKQGPFQLAVDSGYFEGTLSQWLESLQANLRLKASVVYYQELLQIKDISEGDLVYVAETGLVYLYNKGKFPAKEDGFKLIGSSVYDLALQEGFEGSLEDFLQSLKGDPLLFKDLTAEQIELLKGPAGPSAYDVAVKNGFTGSVSQWLGSITGVKGDKGATGDSAYQLALKNGYAGSESSWIRSLKGAQGDQGASAYQVAVDNGFKGSLAKWLASIDGRSAYDLAVENGFTGTKDAWLATLIGSSAYTIAKEEGFVGTKQQWLTSLKSPSAYELAVQQGFKSDLDTWLSSLRGSSAYTVAVENGYLGTREEWLSSLKGASAYSIAVEHGYQGPALEWVRSLQGSNGKSAYEVAVANGFEEDVHVWLENLQGKSAYQVALDNGFTLTEEEWLASLHGASAYTLAKSQGFEGSLAEWLDSLSGSPKYSSKVLMTLGDAITDSTATPSTYPPIVASSLGMTLIDGAGGGGRIRDAFIKTTVVTEEAIKATSIITLAYGTNDFHLETPLGSIGDEATVSTLFADSSYTDTSNQTDGTFYSDYKGVIERLISINPKVRIMLITPLRRTKPSTTGTLTNAKGFEIYDYVKAVKEIAAYYALPCLDNFNTSGFNTLTIPKWTSDGLHPTSWAQKEILANKIQGFILAN